MKIKNMYLVEIENYDHPLGMWMTDEKNVDIKNLIEEYVMKNFICVSGRLIDDSLSECTFVYAEDVPTEEDLTAVKFKKITYNELIERCKRMEIVIKQCAFPPIGGEQK